MFIAAYLLWQVILPLRYYVGDDRADERFAWRMFSATRLFQARCNVTVDEWTSTTGPPVARRLDLPRTVHASWRNLLVGDRPAVVEKFLWSRCSTDPSTREVRFLRRCRLADGTWLRASDLRLSCATGVLSGTRGVP